MTAPARTARGVRGRRNRFHQAGEGRWRRGNSLWQKEAKKLRGGLLTLGRTLGRAELQSSNDLQTPPPTMTDTGDFKGTPPCTPARALLHLETSVQGFLFPRHSREQGRSLPAPCLACLQGSHHKPVNWTIPLL